MLDPIAITPSWAQRLFRFETLPLTCLALRPVFTSTSKPTTGSTGWRRILGLFTLKDDGESLVSNHTTSTQAASDASTSLATSNPSLVPISQISSVRAWPSRTPPCGTLAIELYWRVDAFDTALVFILDE